jgi:hypothetical protein
MPQRTGVSFSFDVSFDIVCVPEFQWLTA